MSTFKTWLTISLMNLCTICKMPKHFLAEGSASLHPSGKYFISGGSDLWLEFMILKQEIN